MKDVLYRNRQSLEKRRKVISIHETSPGEDYVSRVRKNLIYVVKEERRIDPEIQPPEVYIRKSVNSILKIEKFSFRVKGTFYIAQEDTLFKVFFRHSLFIKIEWKADKFSSKKSATLT